MSPTTTQQPLTTEEEALFRAWWSAIIRVNHALDKDLMSGPRLSFAEYGVLMHLSEAPDRYLRMGDLASACQMSLSGMTRLVTHLEGQGLVARVKCKDDGRGYNAVLTDAGFARLEEAYPTHLASVRRHFIDQFEGIDLKQLAAVLERCAAE